jgi:hypothetical protein
MKEAKICIIALLVTCFILISTSFALPACAEAAPVTSVDYYGKLVAVTSSVRIETSIWAVSCRDRNGEVWQFLNDTGELEQGDILTLLMFRVNENEKDDECMDYMYEGHSHNLDAFFEVMEWR